VLPISLDTVITEICNGDSILVGGAYQTTAGYYLDELVATTGCDSNVVTQLVITGPCGFPSPVVYVDKEAFGLNNGTSWANAFNDLQDGLDAVSEYENVHEIWIAEGVYYPSSDGEREASFILTDSVIIYGGFLGTETMLEDRTADPALVQISGDIGVSGDSTDNVFHVVKVDPSCNNCIIERNTSLLEGAAIYSSGAFAKLTIRDCIFRLNTSGLERDLLNADGAQLFFEGLNQIQH
jgi:hypothetical protein